MGAKGDRQVRGAETLDEPPDVARSELRERLVSLAIRMLGGDPEPGAPFPIDRQLGDLGLTSLKMVNLMLAVELEFDISIPQQEITPENFRSVASIERLVRRLCERPCGRLCESPGGRPHPSS
jgi:acyl carrier protein